MWSESVAKLLERDPLAIIMHGATRIGCGMRVSCTVNALGRLESHKETVTDHNGKPVSEPDETQISIAHGKALEGAINKILEAA